mmetsp:Transcript_17972/g.38601  ORF Transcript_17972/g.38601 Transcript_17972/m.38601 type:complete len:233 (-) Transcript_17972:374-1072(-)|eukprot:CAMPEP_0183342130 /NCGR_PEP_ID=MMETSP0164_2-20130417/8295_1 /TAXON_ID=221442 /ORGANISM="Coccolithus pelagicus ssp braarudi, Strain PLY182g" /LENGTH=232 /DNA_ID=CAMNT_0025512629 /DNA_START=52 /DNA_END=750 /DNA_ORIENTATION=+
MSHLVVWLISLVPAAAALTLGLSSPATAMALSSTPCLRLSGSQRPSFPISRRVLLIGATSCAGIPIAAFAESVDGEDEDGEADDEVPDLRAGSVGPRKRSRPTEPRVKSYSSADGQLAYVEIVAARSALETIDRLVSGGDLMGAAVLVGKRPLSTFQENALVLVQSAALPDPEAKKSIGTVKRFGLAADVVILVGALREALEGGDVGGSRSLLKKAKAPLDEIILIGKAAGL